MNPGCLFGPLLWLIGRDLSKNTDAKTPPTNSPMGEGEIHSGPGGYEDGSYTGGYAEDYFHDEN